MRDTRPAPYVIVGSNPALAAGVEVPPAARARTPTVVVRRRQRTFPWLGVFLACQFLWGAFLFLPGSQKYRPIIRALPYAASAALFAVYWQRSSRGPASRGTLPLLFALILLPLNLLHTTGQFNAGLAQILFQTVIAAPMFWGHKAILDGRALHKLLVFAFLASAASA